MRIFVTADTHHGMGRGGTRLTDGLVAQLRAEAAPEDALVIAGDVACGDGEHLDDCLARFAVHPGPKALVPGNHDLWSQLGAGQGSRILYEKVLPAAARRHGFRMLDEGPLRLNDGTALAGSYGGYDHGLADLSVLGDAERREVEEAWKSGRFRTVFWNDYKLMWDARGPLDHPAFARECAGRLQEQLRVLEADETVTRVVLVTHTGAHVEQVKDHPLGAGRPLAGNLWFQGVSGSGAVRDVLRGPSKVTHALCGHTHHERRYEDEHGRLYVNLGCDYPEKRWLVLEEDGACRFLPWIK